MDSKIQSGEIIFTPDETRIIRKIYLNKLDGRTPETILFGKDVGTTRDAASEIKALFDDKVPFDTPKPTALIQHLISLAGARGNDIVMDFFAGSGTAGDATWKYNVREQQNLRTVLVQLPEPLDLAEEQQKVAAEFCDQLGKPRTIAELTKERWRRAGKMIREANPMFAGDLGFRVFKLASSNIRAWEPDRADLVQSLEASVEHLKTDRTEQDILFEVLLKLGLNLTVPIEQKTIASHQVHSIGAGTLIVCLSKSIAAKEVEPLALGIAQWHKAQSPAGETNVVLRDSAFADDVAKTNLTAILQQHGLENVRSL